MRTFQPWLRLTVALVAILLVSSASAEARTVTPLDESWKFYKGDFALPANVGIPFSTWQWKPAAEASSIHQPASAVGAAVQAGDWAKVGSLSDELPAGSDEGEWKDGAPGAALTDQKTGWVWFRALLPATPGTPSYVYFPNAPQAALVYFNRKLVTPRIYNRWDASVSIPLENWQAAKPNVLMVLVKATDAKNEPDRAILITNDAPHAAQTPAATSGPASTTFDDAAWKPISLPHDYVIEGVFDPKENPNHAYLPLSPGWYRRNLAIPAADKGQRLWLEFDGAYANAMLWINGKFVGLHYSGYNSYLYDISGLVRYGGDNLLAVRLDPRQVMGWWYEGGGLYRHVRLVTVAPVHVAPGGIQVLSTVADPGDGLTATAEVNIRTSLETPAGDVVDTTIVSQIIDAAGHVVASREDSRKSSAEDTAPFSQKLTLPAAQLWSPDHPRLYSVRTTVRTGSVESDQVQTTFGIRKIVWDAERGLILNGIPVKIKGTCNHGDFIGVGTGLPDRVQEWRIQKLRELGSNGYRCSHNPPAPEMLDACDRLGMMVLDENRFLGDSAETLGQVRNMVLRDRNHPSVILWSISNEEPAQGTALGEEQSRSMVAAIRELDDRKITAAMNHGWGSGQTNAVDVQGYNYNPNMYDEFHAKFPAMPGVATETASTQTTRGIYANDPKSGYVSAYNTKKAPPDLTWKAVATRPFVAGAFVWTGFEYKGEPSPYKWPCVNSNYGIMDNCGFPKDDYYYYKAWWNNAPSVHIGGHWNWDGKQHQAIQVNVYSNCERVELFLNGRSLGAKDVVPLETLEWQVPYEPGVLEARASRGPATCRHRIETTGAPAAIELIPDRALLDADGKDVSIIAAHVIDAQGRTVPTASSNKLAFSVQGAGKIIGVGNGDPSSHEPDQASERTVFNGLAMVLVQSSTQAGSITVSASSVGIKSAVITLNARPVSKP